MDTLSVDEYGFVWLGGLKICRITNWGVIEFYDRDRIRADKRGSNFVYADPKVLTEFFMRLTGEARWKSKEPLPK